MSEDTDDNETTEEIEREYNVCFSGTANTYVTVTAKNPEAAVDAAHDELTSSLCWQCASPNNSGFRSLGPVEREWPEYMEVAEVTLDGETIPEDDYS